MPERLQADFDHRGMIANLVGQARHGALGTLMPDGAPFVTLVALAWDEARRPVIITSHLSGHTGHMERDGKVSLLIGDIGKGDPLAHPRLTLTGRALAAHPGDDAYPELRALYLGQQPKAALYVDLPGFWFWRISPERAALNGGFGKAWNGAWASLGPGA